MLTPELQLACYLMDNYGDCAHGPRCGALMAPDKVFCPAAALHGTPGMDCPHWQSWKCGTYEELAKKQKEVYGGREGEKV